MTPETAAQTLRQLAELKRNNADVYRRDKDRSRSARLDDQAEAAQMGADALDAQGWRPIAEAPKEMDGTGLTRVLILGFAPDETGYTLPSREGFWSLSLRRWVSSLNPADRNSAQPTHYRLLPTPPEEAK